MALTEPTPQAILHDASGHKWMRYTDPQHIVVARKIEEILPALDRIQRTVEREKLTAVGFLSYESAPAFDPALSVKADGEFPLLWFGLFHGAESFDYLPAGSFIQSKIDWQSSLRKDEYQDKIGRIHEYIRNGDTYQVNFSYRLRTNTGQKPLDIFSHLMTTQETPYSAFIDTGEWAILSASPELFFRSDGDHIESKPMKGTSARGLWYDDDCRKGEILQASEKERAENLMIVDMVRNDLGRIAETGSVKVPELFVTERYPTVWQMTSTVCGRTNAQLSEMFQALFPPASVTGAPKGRAMEIISELESSPRRIYTGAIGRVSPGRKMQFNVAIRTLLMKKGDNHAEYGVGSGIVWDSEANREWEECSIKAKILHPRMPEFDLVETMHWSPDNGFSLLEYHLHRLEQSAVYFGFKVDLAQIRNRLNRLAHGLPALSHRVRLLLSRSGSIDMKTSPIRPEQSGFGEITIARSLVDSSNVFLYHKTTNREVYEEALRGFPGLDDVILFNEKGEVTETTIANVAIGIDGKMFTPPTSCGLLAGTYRAWLIDQRRIEEKPISLEELRQSTNVYLMNSVRGIHKVRLAASQ